MFFLARRGRGTRNSSYVEFPPLTIHVMIWDRCDELQSLKGGCTRTASRPILRSNRWSSTLDSRLGHCAGSGPRVAYPIDQRREAFNHHHPTFGKAFNHHHPAYGKAESVQSPPPNAQHLGKRSNHHHPTYGKAFHHNHNHHHPAHVATGGPARQAAQGAVEAGAQNLAPGPPCLSHARLARRGCLPEASVA